MPPMIRSRVNNPERVFLNSSDDPRTNSDVGFNVFNCTFDTPILGAKKTMMLRASIPNAQVNIPNYQLIFWYHRLDSATQAPSTNTLRAVRLYPSYYQAPAALGTAFTRNRYFTDPADFVSVLNQAAAVGGDNITYNLYWASGDITFAYNSTTKQITFTGQASGKYYTPAGWNDPYVAIAQNTTAASAWAANTVYPMGAFVTNGGNRYYTYTGSAGTAAFNTDSAWTLINAPISMPNYSGTGTTNQPTLNQYTLNLRVGYAMSGSSPSYGVDVGTSPNNLYANLTNTAIANGTAVPVDSFPNLVYSQCVYLYSNITAGVSLGSNGQHNLLAVVPSNAPQLGVIQYTALTVNMMSKLSDSIYEISIEMRDDANQPFSLPDNAQVNLELAMVYTE